MSLDRPIRRPNSWNVLQTRRGNSETSLQRRGWDQRGVNSQVDWKYWNPVAFEIIAKNEVE